MATTLEIAKRLYTQLSSSDQTELKTFIKDYDSKLSYEQKSIKENFEKKYATGPVSSLNKCEICGRSV
jgi:hypothetical protein